MNHPAFIMITELSQLDPNGTYTYADYITWQLQERIELIRGKIFPMSPAPSTNHQRVSLRLSGIFGNLLKNAPCELFIAPFDVRLPVPKGKKPFTVVQPDLCMICDPAKLDEQGCNGAPDLVVEILSPGNTQREMREKYEVYEEAGVKEYWLVGLGDQTVFVYVLNEAGKFIGLQPYSKDDTVISPTFPNVLVDLKEVFPA